MAFPNLIFVRDTANTVRFNSLSLSVTGVRARPGPRPDGRARVTAHTGVAGPGCRRQPAEPSGGRDAAVQRGGPDAAVVDDVAAERGRGAQRQRGPAGRGAPAPAAEASVARLLGGRTPGPDRTVRGDHYRGSRHDGDDDDDDHHDHDHGSAAAAGHAEDGVRVRRQVSGRPESDERAQGVLPGGLRQELRR